MPGRWSPKALVGRQPALRAAASLAEEALLNRQIERPPPEAAVEVGDTDAVVLSLSRRRQPAFYLQAYLQETAFAAELAARGVGYALTEDAAELFGKRVLWAHPHEMVTPRLWNHARQVVEFAQGLEAQGNRPFVSAAEAAYWENKAHMHRQLDAIGAATPRTLVVSAEDRDELEVDFEPAIVKLEHSAGSEGIHYFDTAAAAAAFVRGYDFRPTEHLLVQEPVRGAARDLRLTLVGDRVIETATYWRIKSPEAVAADTWTTTATTYGSSVVHAAPPEAAVTACAAIMRELGLRTAGIDLMWTDDDVDGPPLMLELSPIYQPNPPKPARYADRTYKEFKRNRYAIDGYACGQYRAFREIAAAILDQGLF